MFILKKKLIWLCVVTVLIFTFYEVMLKTKTVRYTGENGDWSVEINAKLAGLEGSHSIKIRYKGSGTVERADYRIFPDDYEGGYPGFDNKGNFFWACSDCGYYDQKDELLFFIVWEERGKAGEKAGFIVLKRSR
ncbi:hypothetical protein [Cytobacillus pseudoceanisediminis]|uniref:hypothetical protein n=1 Tax=Cytobacillus pseudoceanisediminis TaxID=3051614 RepID=UPI0021634907|nr:hypothetical protein [Cytobacillus firmus]